MWTDGGSSPILIIACHPRRGLFCAGVVCWEWDEMNDKLRPNKDRQDWASPCCRARCNEVPQIEVVSPGSRAIFAHRCARCGEYVWPVMIRLWDSFGKRIKAGDVIEATDCPIDHAERYHAVYRRGIGLEIRDLGCNNVGMWALYRTIRTLGPYWKNLDKLSGNDLEYYWNTTREEAMKR